MTQIWAHRGASGYCPENTIEAFEKAIEMNSDGIELDVQLTKDGQIVVCHDELIDRVSNHKGFLKDFTYEELASFNFNNKMDEKYPFCKIPLLSEVLEMIKPTKLVLNIELKTSPLEKRIDAINKLCADNYKVGILIAPVIMVDNYKKLYEELFITLKEKLSNKVKKEVFFEVIFMTYSYVSDMINKEAFPKLDSLYNKDIQNICEEQ